MSKFFVDPDISKAKTLHTDFYTDTALFNDSKEKIFADSWQFIGDTDIVSSQTNCYPFTLLQDFIDEPLLLTRDKQNKLHCLSNVCTHRGNIIVNEPCHASNLRCKYHGRIFQMDGQFHSMPEFKEVQNFPSPSDNLSLVPLHNWGKWLFTSLSAGRPATDYLDDVIARVGWLPVSDFKYRPELSSEYYVNAHWALYCENYLEGFHIPFVHADLNAVIDYGNYTTELFPLSNVQIGIAKDADDCFDLPAGSPDFGKKIAAYYFWVFPNMMFNFYPWGLSVNIVQPIGVARTKISFLTYILDETKYKKGAGGDLDKVELEDEEVVQQVQRGIRSRFYTHGRYSVTREQGTHHFHRLLSELI
jgi:choline monooxygenase